MARQFSEEQWRTILDLSEAAAELPEDARAAYLESIGSNPEVIGEVLSLLDQYHSLADPADRIGTTMGHFNITGHLGRGGVGEVYSAKDTELERVVALKFLTPEAVALHGSLERFLREARTASGLNHPNIVTIFEVIRSESAVAIVMEFVEGTPLRKLCGDPLPTREIVRIGELTARALAAAHGAGIVHRDIKPENVIVKADGSLKVLDFGLATRIQPLDLPENGISLSHMFAGTWRYMSPEQAGGKRVTAATDIFSLGLVLYELCTGQTPFKETELQASDHFGARTANPPSKLNAAIPAALDSLILKMLAADPASRPSAAGVVDELEKLERQFTSVPVWFRRKAPILALTAFALAAGAAAVFFLPLSPSSSHSVPLMPRAISVESGTKSPPSFSPDGKHILYAWKKNSENSARIYVQDLDSDQGGASQPWRLTRSEIPENSPVWSPDGKTIAFLRGDLSVKATLLLTNPSGDRERALTDLLGPFLVDSRSLEWTPDNKWLITSERMNGHSSLALVSAETGQKRPLMPKAESVNDISPSISPDGKTLAFIRFGMMGNGFGGIAKLLLGRHYDAAAVPVLITWPGFKTTAVRDPIWIGSNHDLLFVADPDGIARFWRSRNGRQPELVGELGEAVAAPVASRTGHRLAYLRGLEDTNIWKLDLRPNPRGVPGLSTQIIASSRMDQRPAPSPDGTTLAFESNRGGFPGIWMADLRNGKTWPLTHLRDRAGSPRWSHDGKWIAFDFGASLFKIPSRGGDPIRLTWAKATDMLPVWSADDKSIYFSSDRSGRSQVWRISADGGDAVPVTAGPGTVPELTPDGKFLYYQKENYRESELWRLELQSGRERLIASNVSFRTVAVGKTAIYFVTPNSSSGFFLRSLSPDTNRITTVSSLPNQLVGGITVSPDDRFLYYAQLDHSGNELMLVNNFQ